MNVFERVCTIIEENLSVDTSEIEMESDLRKDLQADSLAVVELMMELEEAFDIQISDEEIENFKSVGDVVNYIEEQL